VAAFARHKDFMKRLTIKTVKRILWQAILCIDFYLKWMAYA